MTMTLEIPAHFNFWRTVYSHGWCSLPPFHVDKENIALERLIDTPDGNILVARIRQSSKTNLEISIDTRIGNAVQQSVKDIVGTCLRIDEDFSEFYAEAKRHKEFQWIPRMGAGRLLRAPTVFEDTVKMLCTTNCSWALTEIMVGNLCKKLGSKSQDSRFTFPTAEAIADCSEKYLRKEIRAGYRAPYLLELSRQVAKGPLDIESWRASSLPTAELFKDVRSVKGIGPYAAGNILKLLGRYDYLGIDSWCRKKFIEIHRNGRRGSDKVIEKYYEPFGKWRGLFFWLDVTKHWYNQKFPF
jgi:3-methyladenine DNA glycosylase/8-oxoguanine DNA glycosylase